MKVYISPFLALMGLLPELVAQAGNFGSDAVQTSHRQQGQQTAIIFWIVRFPYGIALIS